MGTIGFLIEKEFKQIFRNRSMLVIIFVLPVIQLLILANAATFEIRNIKMGYIDSDNSSISRGLIHKFEASRYFEVTERYPSDKFAQNALLEGKVDLIMEIPSGFDRDLFREKSTMVSLRIDAINAAAAGVRNVYVNQILRDYNRHIVTHRLPLTEKGPPLKQIETIPAFWFNEDLNYKVFMVPGILVLLVTMISLFLSGMNIVREKEIGTLEQINVTPIRKHQFIIGKLLPFWILGLVILTIGLAIARVVFDVPIVGSIGLLYGFTALYLLLILGMGLLISNFTDTQQQAMFIAWFFMVIFILMSGLFTPIESMPRWAQIITLFNPIRYFVEIIRMVMLKGSGLTDVTQQVTVILGYALALNGLAVLTYRKAT